MNEVKVEKLPVIASYILAILFQNYFKGQKYGGFLLSYAKSLLEVSTVSRFQNR